jgi:ActR/RegA family two-component response regulator
MDIELLRKCAKCVYLATEKEVADDIAGHLNAAADEITSLRQQLTKPADDTISVSKGEWEAMKKLLDNHVSSLSSTDTRGNDGTS